MTENHTSKAGNPKNGILKAIIDVMNELDPTKAFDSDDITNTLIERGLWKKSTARTPNRSINMYFSQNTGKNGHVFHRVAPSTYRLTSEYIKQGIEAKGANSILVIGPAQWCIDHQNWLQANGTTSIQYSIKSKYVPGTRSRLDELRLPFWLRVYVPKKYNNLIGSGSIEYACRVIELKTSDDRINSPWPSFKLDSTYRKHEDDKYEFWFKVDQIEKAVTPYRNLTYLQKNGDLINYLEPQTLLGAARGRILFSMCDLPPQHNESEQDEETLLDQVARSLAMNPEERRARLRDAARQPAQVRSLTTAYSRNPDVIAEALFLAEGKCGHCGNPAPFIRRSTGIPYLEVHHKVFLSCGGEDTVENAIAVCPNCHRKMHHG